MNSLPERPSLEFLKAQAKELLTTFRSGQDAARFAAVFPELEPPSVKLADAQHVLAREYGFESWPRLKAHVEQARQSFEDLRRTFVAAARDGDVNRAEQVLRDHREMASAGLEEAALAGNLDYLKGRVTPENVGDLVGSLGWPVIGYACCSTLMRDKGRRPRFVEVIQFLLKQGADPDLQTEVPAFPGNPLSMLYWTGGYNNAPEAAEVLLEAGASSRDNESLYHAADHRDHEFLKLLIKYKVEPSNTNALKRMLDFEDSEGLALLLSTGIDPNEYKEQPAIHHAIRRGRSPRLLRQLIEGGADPSTPDEHGVTPYNLAVSLGKEAAAATIAEKGGDASLSEAAATLRMAHRGENLDSAVVGRLHEAMPDVMHLFAETGEARPIKALLDAGHPPDSLGLMYNCTPLHMACHGGFVECVRALLEAGSRLDVKDTMYHGWPIGWAMHGALFLSGHVDPDGSRYRAIVQMLIDRGTPIEEPPEGRADLAAMLKEELARRAAES